MKPFEPEEVEALRVLLAVFDTVELIDHHAGPECLCPWCRAEGEVIDVTREDVK